MKKKSSDYIRAASIESMSALAEGRSTLSLTVIHTSSPDMELTQTLPCRCLFLLTSWLLSERNTVPDFAPKDTTIRTRDGIMNCGDKSLFWCV
jgi:hypothetical protein